MITDLFVTVIQINNMMSSYREFSRKFMLRQEDHVRLNIKILSLIELKKRQIERIRIDRQRFGG